ncbi:MAG: type IV pilus assembly protein PilM [Phycisphaerae bacterium]|nr:type IV pilus assembly protein PilM [Phycisphaerae bacterium]
MLNGLLGMGRWPIGLDIGTSVVRMLQLQRTGGQISVVSAGKRELPPGNETGPGRRKAIAEAVSKILRNGRFRGRQVVSALSCNEMHVKNVRMPVMSDRELADAVRWEAGERLPFKPSGDQLRWVRAGQIRKGTDVREEVIMLAAAPDAVENHLALLEEAGLVAAHIDAEPLALFRVFTHFLRREDDEKVVSVVADIGHSGTRVTVARGRQIVFVKAIDISGKQLTQAVAKHLNLTPAEAAELRLRVMHDADAEAALGRREEDDADASHRPEVKDWTLRDAIRAPAEALAREISLCLRYCSVTFRGLRPKKLVLTGGESYDPALVALLSENLGVECVVGEPLRGVDVRNIDPNAGNRRGSLSDWAVCAGLATRDVTFENAGSEVRHGERRLSA